MTKATKVRFFKQEGERQYVRAQRIWQILIGYVEFKQNISKKGNGIITYGDLAVLLGYNRQAGRTLSAPLGYIHRFCKQNGLPQLNAIVVRKDTDIAGWEEMFPDEKRHKKEQKKVKEYDWFRVRIPTPGAFKNYPYQNDEDM